LQNGQAVISLRASRILRSFAQLLPKLIALPKLTALSLSLSFALAGPSQLRAEPAFDFYVLALSWSPSFCLTNEAQRAKPADQATGQCALGAASAFVLHGLWPQYEVGFPSDCTAGQPASPVFDQAKGLWPDEGLARYEWRKHGTCSGKGPSGYFADVRQALAKVIIPLDWTKPKQEMKLKPIEVERAFVAQNPQLRPGMLAVTCQKGFLQEVRICLSKDVNSFRPCPDVVKSACRADRITIPAVR